MLSLLHIENIALIESADIHFGAGFNVLTGETGAGKSIVVDSIGAVLGERTSRDLIRTGAKSAVVHALFTDVMQMSWLEENGIELPNGELLLQRELRPDGKNTCRVNGRPITTTQLRELGHQMLNIHGQHDGQQLLDPECHLDYLDRFGKNDSALRAFQTEYQKLAALDRRIASLAMDEAERSRRVDTLEFQIRELERAELKPGEDEELNARKSLLRSAGKLMEALQNAECALGGTDDTLGANALLSEAHNAVSGVSQLSPELEALSETLAELRFAAEDVSDQLRELGRNFDFSPEELDQLEGRLDILYRLRKKYGATVEEMLSYLQSCKDELDEIQFADDTIQKLEKERAILLSAAKEKAERLSEKRKDAAAALTVRVEDELMQLDMPKVRFLVQFASKGGTLGMDESGADQVQFVMSANVGEDLKPIQKVASGGELARIMLALKNVLAEDDGIHSLVFDEVDTGVSGRAAQKVAEKMANVARGKQVLCVTHLPQIAAMADSHLCVEKGEHDGRTFTHVEELTQQGRQRELARLIGGATITQSLLDSASELLHQAEEYKQKTAS